MMMLTLNNTILLMGVRARNTVSDAIILQKVMQRVIFYTIIRLNHFNCGIKISFNIFLPFKDKLDSPNDSAMLL